MSDFTRSGRMFIRAAGDITHIVHLQIAEGNMTINVGVFATILVVLVPELHMHMAGKKSVGEADCQLRLRISDLIPGQRDIWWRAESLQEAEAIGMEMARLISTYALPFFASLVTLMDLAWYFHEDRPSGIGPKAHDKIKVALEPYLYNPNR